MTHAQPVMSRCAKSNALLPVAIDSRYLETRQKALELFAKTTKNKKGSRDKISRPLELYGRGGVIQTLAPLAPHLRG
jgi:hypothetical protein